MCLMYEPIAGVNLHQDTDYLSLPFVDLQSASFSVIMLPGTNTDLIQM